MEEKVDHPRSKMLVGFLLVDRLHLLATMVVDLSTMVVMGLKRWWWWSSKKVTIVNPKRQKSKIICYRTNKTVDRAYLESMVPFMVSCPTPYDTKSFAK
jgi:hypothetical protein